MASRRDMVRIGLLKHAEADPRVAAAAVVGSMAAGTDDEWSDVDLFLGVAGAEPAAVLEDFSTTVYQEFGALHHFDLAAGAAVYRAFLLAGAIEIDLGLAPMEDFRSSGGQPFKIMFGTAQPAGRVEPLDTSHAIGLIWHHVLHARNCIERDKPWQAAYWISALRDQVLSLAAHRYGLPTMYAKGADLLPDETTAALTDTLVGSLDRDALRAALRAATGAALRELREHDPVVADRLGGPLGSVTGR